MLVHIDHLNIGPRMDNGPKPFDPNQTTTSIVYYDDSDLYQIEVYDLNNPEFRLQLILTESELLAAKANPKRGL